MSPRALDPAVRASLTEAAVRILGSEGRGALSTRRLAREANTSTMAVYTHFGNIDEVHRQVRRRALEQLLGVLRESAATSDPVADLARSAAGYVQHGRQNPALYRVMFVDQPPDDHKDPAGDVFTLLRDLVERCIREGRFHSDRAHDPDLWAGQVWTMCHGAVTLALTGALPVDQLAAMHADMTYRLCVGFGDDPRLARESVTPADPSA